MALTNNQRIELNKGSIPSNQKVQLGDAVYSAPVVLIADIDAAANATAKSVTVPFDCEVIDVVVQARATSAGGTATVRKVTTAICDAVAMAADTTIARAGTLDDAQSTLSAGDDLNVITNGANDRGLVSIICRRI
jgi:hypothetical protein